MNANQVHTTVTWPVAGGLTWAWSCEDCPATSGGYRTEARAQRVAAIHEDPSRKQGRKAATKNRTKPMKKTITTLALGAALLTALVGCGTSKANEAVANAPRPTVTVTKTVTPPPVVATVNIKQVPQACLDALDNADLGFTYAGQAFTAASELDVATMNAMTAKIAELAPKYNADKAACRAAGGQ